MKKYCLEHLLKLKYGFALMLLLLCPVAYAQNIESFGNTWSFMSLLNYRYLQYQEADLFSCRTNTPFEMRLGVGFRYFSVSFGIRIPFLHEQTVPVSKNSVDANMKIFSNRFSCNAFIASYPSFFMENQPAGRNIDLELELLSAGIELRWILFPGQFSFRSVYNLDRKQLSSNGSFWAGVDNYLFSIFSTEEKLPEYALRRVCLYTGPSLGYAYTWVFRNGLFFNMDMGGSLNMGMEIGQKNFLFMPVLMSGVIFGAHFKDWSFSLSLSANIFFSLGAGVGDNPAAVPNRLSQISATPIKIVTRH